MSIQTNDTRMLAGSVHLDRAVSAALAERRRQRAVEGFSRGHDDRVNADGQLAMAAAAYALPAEKRRHWGSWWFTIDPVEFIWPWALCWWKPTPFNRKREIEKALALLLAEWERLDRMEEQIRVGQIIGANALRHSYQESVRKEGQP